MRKASEIYEESKLEVHKNGSQSLPVMAIVAIEKAQKEMFYYLYELAEKEEDKDRLIQFFDKLDGKLNFN